MLPSFRLIAATFLCGFVVVFAGLRVATSLNDIHEALPVLTVHAATLTVAGARDARGAPVAVPMLYDLRFVASSATIAPIPASVDPYAIDRAAPVVPLAVEDVAKPPRPAADATKAELEPTKREDAVVAAIKPEAPVSPEPAEPQRPQPAAVAAVDPLATPSREAPTAAVVEPQPTSSTTEKPAAEPAAAASTDPAVNTAAVESEATPAPDSGATEPPVAPATVTATVEPPVAPAPEIVAAEPPVAPATVTATVEPPVAPAPEIVAAEPPATGTVDTTVPGLDPTSPAATEVPLPRPPAARPALRAKAKLVRSKRTAAKDGFGDPFGNWPR